MLFDFDSWRYMTMSCGVEVEQSKQNVSQTVSFSQQAAASYVAHDLVDLCDDAPANVIVLEE